MHDLSIQQQRDICHKEIALADKMERLMKNQDFVELVLEDYLTEELMRCAKLLPLTTGERKLATQCEVESIMRFKNYVDSFAHIKKQAQSMLLDLDEQERELSETQTNEAE